MSADILGKSWHQCRSMTQYCSTSTETRRLVRTDSAGRPPRLSHSSWTMQEGGRCSWDFIVLEVVGRSDRRDEQFVDTDPPNTHTFFPFLYPVPNKPYAASVEVKHFRSIIFVRRAVIAFYVVPVSLAHHCELFSFDVIYYAWTVAIMETSVTAMPFGLAVSVMYRPTLLYIYIWE